MGRRGAYVSFFFGPGGLPRAELDYTRSELMRRVLKAFSLHLFFLFSLSFGVTCMPR